MNFFRKTVDFSEFSRIIVVEESVPLLRFGRVEGASAPIGVARVLSFFNEFFPKNR